MKLTSLRTISPTYSNDEYTKKLAHFKTNKKIKLFVERANFLGIDKLFGETGKPEHKTQLTSN